MFLKQLNDISKAVDGIESKITEIRGEIEGIEKVSVLLHACCVSSVVISSLATAILPYCMVDNFQRC